MAVVEYAVSGRAGCKACGLKIGAQELRVGEEREGDWGTYMAWKHVQCAFTRGVRSSVPFGVDSLRAEDATLVRAFAAGNGAPVAAPSLAGAMAALSPPRAAAVVAAAGAAAAAAGAADAAESDEARAAREVLLGTLHADIVGVRYYNGVVHTGEYVNLVREPRNAHDANAVRVDNLAGVQVGHIRRQLAAALAPLMDDQTHLRPRVEGSVPRPQSSEFTVPILLHVFGLPEVAAAVASLLARYGARFDPGSGVAAGAGAASSVVATRTIAAASRSQEELDALLDTLSETEGLLPFDAASEAPALTTQLHPYQAAGVSWMLRRERDPDGVVSKAGLPPFWERVQERGTTAFLNSITHSSSPVSPQPVYGGLLADDMGLGKSVQCIATILANPAPGVTYAAGAAAAQADARDDDLESKSLKQLQAEAGRRRLPKTGTKAQLIDKIRGSAAAAAGSVDAGTAPRATLVVCPVSVMASWEEQVLAHTAAGALRVYSFAGAGRNPDPVFLGSFDIVIVSYSTLAAEYNGGEDGAPAGGKRKRAEGIHAVEWRRVVLDEAHTIRNRSTRAHAAALALHASLRWALTGTPIQNRADDAQPLFAFLRAVPLADWSVWNRAVGRPVRDGDPAGLARLRLLLRAMSLRRTKALLSHLIPPKVVEVQTVKLDHASRDAYDALFRSARSAVAAAAAQGDDALLSMYTPVLECILRLRQAVDAAILVPRARLDAARELLRRAGDGSKPAVLDRQEAARLFAALAGALAAPEDSDCCVCLEPLAEAAARVLRACKHTLCETCLGRIAATSPARCPLCRAGFTPRDVLSKDELACAAEAAAPAADERIDEALPLVPPKVAALLEGLAAMAAEGPDRKAVVFSQFTSFLDVVGARLADAGWQWARLDGTMPADARAAALAAWRAPNAAGAPPVLLVSTRAGGVGLNLTSANHCFLLDTWWNAAGDEQAMDRVHRLGQTRPVRVVRYVAQGTVEETMLAMQAAKAALGKGALSKLSADEARTARAADLRTLFDI